MRDSEYAIPMVEQDDKWKLYYEYATKAADEEIALFQRIDTKAFGFLRMLTAVLGIAGAVAVWVFNHFRPIEGFLEWALAIAIIITLLATITSWSFLFRAIKLRDAPRMPLSDEIHQLFQVSLRSRDALWDIPVPKTHSIFDSH